MYDTSTKFGQTVIEPCVYWQDHGNDNRASRQVTPFSGVHCLLVADLLNLKGSGGAAYGELKRTTQQWDSARGVAEGRSICQPTILSAGGVLAHASPLQDCANLVWFDLGH